MPADDLPAITRPVLPSLRLVHRRSTATDTDVLAVAMTSAGKDRPPRAAVPAALAERTVARIEAAAEQIGFTSSAGDTARIPSPEGDGFVLLVGMGSATGPETTPPGDVVRRAAGAATRALAGVAGIARVTLVLAAPDAAAVRAAAEGALLGAHAFSRYKRSARPVLTEIILDTTSARAAGVPKKALEAAAAVAAETAAAIALARDLVNVSPAELYPESFAAIATAEGATSGFGVTVLDEDALREGGYGGLLAVGLGSVRGPRLVVCDYRPKRPRGHVALIGKGITFDSGGLSLKPPASMPGMKADMAGAAAVLATVAAAARSGLDTRVTGYLALAENMPSGSAQRPSDVITVRGGTTVEVLNTDAEGRLVLADALVDASQAQPDAIIDVATLTGAATVALGPRTSGLFGNDDELVARVTTAAGLAGEATWRMPLSTDLRGGLDSAVADIANITTKREGGMIVAALFLQEFVGHVGERPIPWVHLDVAGPAFNEGGADDVTPKGGTGVPVGTLLRLLQSTS